jgi:hypothetical protein
MFATRDDFIDIIVGSSAGLKNSAFGLPKDGWRERQMLIGRWVTEFLFSDPPRGSLLLARAYHMTSDVSPRYRGSILSYFFIIARVYECEESHRAISGLPYSDMTWVIGKNGVNDYWARLDRRMELKSELKWLWDLAPYYWDEIARLKLVQGSSEFSANSLEGVVSALFRTIKR